MSLAATPDQRDHGCEEVLLQCSLDEETKLIFIWGHDLGQLIIASIAARTELGCRLLALGILNKAEAKAIHTFVIKSIHLMVLMNVAHCRWKLVLFMYFTVVEC